MALVPAKGHGVLVPVEEDKIREELHKLCLTGSTDQAAYLLDTVPPVQLATSSSDLDPEGSSALHVAARTGHLLLTQELIRRGLDCNLRDVCGRTPLHVASLEGHAEICFELVVGRADVNVLDKNHESALHKAVLADNVEVLEVLVDRGGADPTVVGGAGVTPMLLAAERGHVGPLEALLKRDAGLAHAQNESGWTPLHLAAHGDTQQRKVTGARQSKFPRLVRLLLDAGGKLDARDEDTKTPLHRAAATGNLDIATALVEAGADVSAADICRWTPLHYACQEGHLGVIQLLLKAKAAVQTENPPCNPPLAVAVLENQVKVAEVLLKFGADPNLRGKGLASPLMIARKDKEKYSDMLALFELGFVHHH